MSGLDPKPEEDPVWDYYYRLYYDDDDDFQNSVYTPPRTMAEGGIDPTDPTNEKTPLIPNTGDDDNDDNTNPWADTSKWQYGEDGTLERIPTHDTDTKNPFEPKDSSTPAGGENIPMSTRLPPERQGARGSPAETSFTTGFDQGNFTQDALVRRELENEFPNISATEINLRYKEAPKSGGSIIEVKYYTSDKWYPLFTKTRGDLEKTLNTALPAQIKNALGKSTTEAINETNAELQTLNQQEKTQIQQLHQTENRAEEAQRLRREMDAIRGRMQETEDRMRELENAHGPLDPDAIQKLKDAKRELEADHQEKRKQLNALAKAAKEAQQTQQELNKTRLRKGETERRLGELKARKDAIQPLDELKQKAEELKEHNTEDTRIIEDEKTSPSEKEAARERLATRNAELAKVNEEIKSRERQRPLLERVKDIFKKYGWTLQAVALAVGIVLSALALAATNGLKAGTKALAQGLKAIGQKLGSLLPGLIGSIVSYIFKAAGSVLSFLGEHAWLLILAVVPFFMERLLKRRRR